jgi:hypothetical protein
VRLPALAGRRAEPLALPGFAPAPGFALDAAGAGRVQLAPRSGAIWRV